MEMDSTLGHPVPSRHTENRHTATGNTCVHFQTYGLTCDEYDQLRERAGGRCEICATPEQDTVRGTLVIDHFDGGGAWFVRGLLCDKCNSVMSRHDRATEWGPSSLPFADKARAYHLSAFGKPSTEELRLADEYIQSRKPFSVRNLPKRIGAGHKARAHRVGLDRGPKRIAQALRKHLSPEQIERLIELLRDRE